jgi:hypothetical protein
VDKVQVPNVVRISEIRGIDGVVISPEIYNLYNNNIVWLVARSRPQGIYRVPPEGEGYEVTLKNMVAKLEKFTELECPRCNGNKWYLSPIQEGSSIEVVTGPYLVAQEFLKNLLTVPKTDRLDTMYGAGLLTETSVMMIDNQLENTIRSAVSVAEQQCKERGLSDPSRTIDEILDKAIIDSIEIDIATTSVYVFITLLTIGGKQARLSLKM